MYIFILFNENLIFHKKIDQIKCKYKNKNEILTTQQCEKLGRKLLKENTPLDFDILEK